MSGSRSAQSEPRPPESTLSGRVFGSYRITGLVAEGSTGKVYRAEHTQLGRPAALKLLLDSAAADDELAARFEREAKAAARIQDPHVAQVFELGVAEGGVRYLAQELVEGESLATRLERGTLDPDACLALGIGLAAGLAAIHKAGLVHRDLKPANVLLDPHGSPKIVDFGLVRDRHEAKHQTQRGVLLGTPLYMAPEQLGVEGEGVGPAADLFALGCVLHQALTGRVPHDTGDRDLRAFFARRAEEQASAPPEVDAELARVVVGLLTLEPDGRPEATAVQRTLSDLRRRGRSVPTRPPVPARNAWVWLPLAVGAMLLAGIVGGVALVKDDAPPAATPTTTPPTNTQTPTPTPTPTPIPTLTPAATATATAGTPAPTPTASASPATRLAVGLRALSRLELDEAERALRAAPSGVEVNAARELLVVLRAVNGDGALTEMPKERELFLRAIEAPQTHAVVNSLGGAHALGFYRRARYALEQRRPVALWLAFRGYGVVLRLRGQDKPPPNAARFLRSARRVELPALLLLGRAAERSRRQPRLARADLDQVLAPPLGSTPLIARESRWLRAWRDRLAARD